MPRAGLKDARTVVVKVGSSLLASLQGGLDSAFIYRLVGELAALRAAGKRVILVSSGAVAAGLVELGMRERPTSLPEIQAAAAVGQSALMQLYRDAFGYHKITVGQVLLTRDGLQDRQRYLYARNTMLALLAHEVLPIVNENDTVAVEELKLKIGDNDALAVSVAQLADADCLLLLTDVPGLYERPPAEGEAELIRQVSDLTPEFFAKTGGSGSAVGSGGMTAKLNAARAATMAGIPLIVADGRREHVLRDILAGEEVGTLFVPRERPTDARRHWIAFSRGAEGALVVDDGAQQALVDGKKSLLAIGIREVRGTFAEGESVRIVALDGREIGRGLVNFAADECRRLAGRRSHEFAGILGYDCCDTVVHRDNLVII